jgi:hypothetical protein
VWQTRIWGVNGLGFCQLLWYLGLVNGFWAISLNVLSPVDHWACWALDPWWITEMLDPVYRGLKKWASTQEKTAETYFVKISILENKLSDIGP